MYVCIHNVYRIHGCRNCEAELVHTHRAVLVAVAYKGQLVCVGSSYNFTEQTANCRVDAMSRFVETLSAQLTSRWVRAHQQK